MVVGFLTARSCRASGQRCMAWRGATPRRRGLRPGALTHLGCRSERSSSRAAAAPATPGRESPAAAACATAADPAGCSSPGRAHKNMRMHSQMLLQDALRLSNRTSRSDPLKVALLSVQPFTVLSVGPAGCSFLIAHRAHAQDEF